MQSLIEYITYQLQTLCPTSTFAAMPGTFTCLRPDQATLQTLQALAQENVITEKLVFSDDQIVIAKKAIDVDGLGDFVSREEGRKEQLAAAEKPLNICLEIAAAPSFSFDGNVLSAPFPIGDARKDMKAILAFLQDRGAIGGFWADDQRISIYRADPNEAQYNVLHLNNATFNQMRKMMGRQPEKNITIGVC